MMAHFTLPDDDDREKENSMFVGIHLGMDTCSWAFPLTEPPTLKDVYVEDAPTVLLLNPDGTLHSFGKAALDDYADLDSEGEAQRYYLFDRFTVRRAMQGTRV